MTFFFSHSIFHFFLILNFRAYAKALHYKEEEFLRGGSKDYRVIEALISINNKLQQKESAEGLLQCVMHDGNEIQVQVRWYEKLHNWEKALGLYKEKLINDPTNQDACLGQMRYVYFNLFLFLQYTGCCKTIRDIIYPI